MFGWSLLGLHLQHLPNGDFNADFTYKSYPHLEKENKGLGSLYIMKNMFHGEDIQKSVSIQFPVSCSGPNVNVRKMPLRRPMVHVSQELLLK